MRSVINVLKYAIKYGGLIFAIIEIIEFAIEKLEKFSNSDQKKEVKSESAK